MGEAPQPTASRTTSGAISFRSGRGECEEKTIIWKIDNVAEFFEMSNEELEENGVIFEAGNCVLNDGTRIKATWKYFFECERRGYPDSVGGYLHFPLGLLTSAKSARAWHSVALYSGVDLIASYSMTGCEEFVGSSGWGRHKLVTKSELLQKTKETNSLEVNLLVKVFSNQGFKPVLQGSLHAPLEVTEMRGQATSDFVKMLESGDGADVDIKVPNEAGGEVDEFSYTKKVHKGILMSRSTVFAAMFAKESEMVEAKTGKVVINDMSPQGLGVFLHYLYTGEVLADWVQVLPELLNAAEKYDCGKLKDFCGNNLLPAVTAANAIKMHKLAKLHNLPFAADGVLEFIRKNATTVITEEVIDKIAL